MNKNLVHIFMARFIIRAINVKKSYEYMNKNLVHIFMALFIIRAMNVKKAMNI